jgi:hypothetical protein
MQPVMDIEAALASTSTKLNAPARTVLTLDIERLPGIARHQHRGLTIEGDFWDLGSWRHLIGYRIPHESVVEWPRTICVAWQFYGAKPSSSRPSGATDTRACCVGRGKRTTRPTFSMGTTSIDSTPAT